jgi:uncharacterized membrane protein YidH (DUF202 family)
MSNFALTTFILLVFIFAAGLALFSLARARYEQQKRINRGRQRQEPEKLAD